MANALLVKVCLNDDKFVLFRIAKPCKEERNALLTFFIFVVISLKAFRSYSDLGKRMDLLEFGRINPQVRGMFLLTSKTKTK